MNQMTDELAVRKSVFVRCTPEHAFTVFTERIGDWWPFDGHSLFDDKAEAVVFEPHVGGRVYERSAEGEEGLWGTLTVWDPPRGFTMTWHPGRGEETAQELELRFSPEGGGTRVDLVHTGLGAPRRQDGRDRRTLRRGLGLGPRAVLRGRRGEELR